MYFRPASAPKRRTSQMKMWPAPTAGWVSNRNISVPQGGPQGAAVLDNFFPTATGAVLRRGKLLYTTLPSSDTPTALFSYSAGINERLFAATQTTIYDVTDPNAPSVAMDGFTSGKWSVVQFATTGGIFLIGVNGQDRGFIYDGTAFYENIPGGIWSLGYTSLTEQFIEGETITGSVSSATGTVYRVNDNGDGTGTLWLTGITGTPFESGEALTGQTAGDAQASGAEENVVTGVTFDTGAVIEEMSYVWVYKNRLFFVEADSLNAWYMKNPDAIGGDADAFPLGGVLTRGGSLLFGYTWSLDSGDSGGLSEQCIFVSTEGEVAVYQGTDPSQAAQWSKVGVYRIGRPLGQDAFMRAGGDVVIATTIGFIPLSQAIQRDYAALSPAAVSFPIEEAWSKAIDERGYDNWICEIWPENQLVMVAPPTITGSNEPVVFAANAGTGAWGRYTNWNVKCAHSFNGSMYFGSLGGEIYLANVGGMDGNNTYTGVYMPLFEDLGSPASIKIGTIGRAVLRSRADVDEALQLHLDYDTNLDPAPNASFVPTGNQWGSAVWGQSKWGGATPEIMNQDFHSVGGSGYTLSLSVQVTSGATAPIDTEIIRLELMFNTAEVIT